MAFAQIEGDVLQCRTDAEMFGDDIFYPCCKASTQTFLCAVVFDTAEDVCDIVSVVDAGITQSSGDLSPPPCGKLTTIDQRGAYVVEFDVRVGITGLVVHVREADPPSFRA